MLRALDLFCGAGGATKGLQRAGFHVTGVDINPQPRYCGDAFHQADAMTFSLEGFDFIWASPPCQAHSAGRQIWKGRLPEARHPELIAPIRRRLCYGGVLYVIENVERAPLLNPITLCGLTFGLGVKRHRLFETRIPIQVEPCPQGHPGNWISVFGGTALSRTPSGGQRRINGKHNGRGAYDGRIHISHLEASKAMGIDWMSRDELSQAIPPAYAEYIGRQAAAALAPAR